MGSFLIYRFSLLRVFAINPCGVRSAQYDVNALFLCVSCWPLSSARRRGRLADERKGPGRRHPGRPTGPATANFAAAVRHVRQLGGQFEFDAAGRLVGVDLSSGRVSATDADLAAASRRPAAPLGRQSERRRGQFTGCPAALGAAEALRRRHHQRRRPADCVDPRPARAFALGCADRQPGPAGD